MLFDPGAIDSFVSVKFSELLQEKHVLAKIDALEVCTPVGSSQTSSMLLNIPVQIHGHSLLADLYVLDMNDFDFILGMDWLGSLYAYLDCSKRMVTFCQPGVEEFSFQCPKSNPCC